MISAKGDARSFAHDLKTTIYFFTTTMVKHEHDMAQSWAWHGTILSMTWHKHEHDMAQTWAWHGTILKLFLTSLVVNVSNLIRHFHRDYIVIETLPICIYLCSLSFLLVSFSPCFVCRLTLRKNFFFFPSICNYSTFLEWQPCQSIYGAVRTLMGIGLPEQ